MGSHLLHMSFSQQRAERVANRAWRGAKRLVFRNATGDIAGLEGKLFGLSGPSGSGCALLFRGEGCFPNGFFGEPVCQVGVDQFENPRVLV
jgi:hypothetical protein